MKQGSETYGSVAKRKEVVRVLEAGRAMGLYETEDGLRTLLPRCCLSSLSPNACTLQIEIECQLCLSS
jgi:hypothetical protein